ncbi:MAG: hypothetical protein A2Z97_02760 [Bdellovibrionales bacterium GWB1_52_6]|nr:MAG: hypothetical protein A2Z97_02760 [Bdellovibrionales bacterium GWB1_52_6]OFZ05817.1 MAG: hypothetical protein A2X97_03910 [Bdellovibrionales bacterium GWA1_52_35]HCM40238.1 NADH-quinone oxidoreductase subunit C [Bdellovibrionales bacterium]
MDNQSLIAAVTAAANNIKLREKADRAAIEVPAEGLLALMQKLRDDAQFSFDMLCDHTVIDWLAEGTFEFVYQLYSMTHQHYLMVLTRVSRDNPTVPSVSSLWKIAEWQERECYDMFGALYDGHKDLRRLFLEDDWKGFPLRKDYKDDFMLERPQ